MSISALLRRLRLLMALALFSAVILRAEEAASPPFTLSQALVRALHNNPALQAETYGARVAEARILQAGVRPNPEVSIEVENAFGTGSLSGVKDLETTLQLSQLVDLAGSRAHEVAVAKGQRAVALADYEEKRITVLADVARRFTEAAADGQRLAAAREARELGEQTVAAARARAEAGAASVVEVHQARIALALLQIEEEHAEHELAVCRQSLAAALGEEDPDFGKIEADLFTLPAMPDFAELADRLEASPALARFAAEARWREAEVQLGQSLRRGGARVSAGLRRAEGTDDIGFVAGFSIPLPVRDQGAGLVREARERRAQLGPALESARLEMRATLFAVYQEMLHARTALDQLTQEVVPTAEESLALVEQGYRQGRFTLAELLDVQTSLVDLRRQIVANAAAFHLHIITVERLLGGSFQPNSSRR